ncbi:MAG: type II toxin-antitoxin system PemK/MazF family toxin [Gammaproteobacteria bacterium]|nr:type II toxin-antitoxin system PemK/MazF family toxin [Gammaproteobacteria bacterium]MBY0544653.1 type II toxin-antitoxin system PemK/MazF family toxin [Gammaproteobacteria bacterium]
MRGKIVSIALQGDYGKPRPALIIQSDLFAEHPSISILPITSELRETPLFRLTIEPSETNGLLKKSQIMIDKIQTISRDKIGEPFGQLTDSELLEVNRFLALFLGLG